MPRFSSLVAAGFAAVEIDLVAVRGSVTVHGDLVTECDLGVLVDRAWYVESCEEGSRVVSLGPDCVAKKNGATHLG